jgi:hypothetical protein
VLARLGDRSVPPVPGAASPRTSESSEREAGLVEKELLTPEQKQAVLAGDETKLATMHARGEDLSGALAFAMRVGVVRDSVMLMLLEKVPVSIAPETVEHAAATRSHSSMRWARRIASNAPVTRESLMVLARGCSAVELLPIMVKRWTGRLPAEAVRSFAYNAPATVRNDLMLRRLLARSEGIPQSPNFLVALARWSSESVKFALESAAPVTESVITALLRAGNARGLHIVLEHPAGQRALGGQPPDLVFALDNAPLQTLPYIAEACLHHGAPVDRATFAAVGRRWVAEIQKGNHVSGAQVFLTLLKHLPEERAIAAATTVLRAIESAPQAPREALELVRKWLAHRRQIARANLPNEEDAVYSFSRFERSEQIEHSRVA